MGKKERMLKAALAYNQKYKLSVIPINPKDKKPMIKWKEYQERLPTVEEINVWWGKDFPGANIAAICGPVSRIMVLDVDLYKDAASGMEIHKRVADSFVTPICDTPRGGEHWHFLYASGLQNDQLENGIDIKTQGGYAILPPSNGANGKPYTWKEGLAYRNMYPSSMPDKLFDYLKKINLPALQTSQGVTSVTSRILRQLNFNEGSRDESLFHVANCLKKGGMEDGKLEQLLGLIGSQLCNPPFPEKEIKAKIKSVMDREEDRSRNLRQEIESFLNITQGYISISECDRELQIVSKKEKINRRVIFHRLVKEGRIEHHPERASLYRKVERQFETVDIDSMSDEPPVDVILPFNIQDYVELQPKDLIVYAGEPNAGKTALMLETVRLNMDTWPCWYFSTEMNRHNCKKRLGKHEGTFKWPFHFSDDFPNYFDVLQENDLNFVDYVECEEAYKIPAILSAIQKKLKNGLAFVALQKFRGRDYGFGGLMTLAKPSLFCAIEPDFPGAKLKIVKAKNYRDENPCGMIRDFKIVGGINIVSSTGWEME